MLKKHNTTKFGLFLLLFLEITGTEVLN